jgi:hypothetical protein
MRQPTTKTIRLGAWRRAGILRRTVLMNIGVWALFGPELALSLSLSLDRETQSNVVAVVLVLVLAG